MDEWPIFALWAFFVFGSMCRGGFLHWLGRRLRTMDQRRRSWLDRPLVARAERVVARYGAVAVVLSYLTVGVQSAIHVASGVLRMPPHRYLPALLLGSMIWAAIYTTVGMAVVYAALGRLDWWWIVAAVLSLVLVWAATVTIRRRTDSEPPTTP